MGVVASPITDRSVVLNAECQKCVLFWVSMIKNICLYDNIFLNKTGLIFRWFMAVGVGVGGGVGGGVGWGGVGVGVGVGVG